MGFHHFSAEPLDVDPRSHALIRDIRRLLDG